MARNGTEIARRELLLSAAALGVVSASFAGVVPAHAQTPSTRAGQVVISDFGAVKLHTYIAPEASAVVTTQIVETPSSLHIIDAQFLQSFAAEARAYADGLGKPIAGLYLSHNHPDHLFGSTQFAETPFMTSDGVMAAVNQSGDVYAGQQANLGPEGPGELRLPTGGLALGAQSWDGVDVVIEEIADCEAPATLTFHLLGQGALIAQDLVYSGAHAFPLGNTANWRTALAAMLERDDIRVIGAGHGMPTSKGSLTNAIAYLDFMDSVLNDAAAAEEAITALRTAYPAYDGQALLNFINFRFQ